MITTERDEDLIFLHESIIGEKLERIEDPKLVVDMLGEGMSNIIMSLHWGEKRGDEVHDEHEVILQGITDDDRIFFYNPLHHDPRLKPGVMIGGSDSGPERMVEDAGLESVTVEQFVCFFKERNAVCYYPAGLAGE